MFIMLNDYINVEQNLDLSLKKIIFKSTSINLKFENDKYSKILF